MRLINNSPDLETRTLDISETNEVLEMHKEKVYGLLDYLKERVEEERKVVDSMIEQVYGANLGPEIAALKENLKKGIGIGMTIVLGYNDSMKKYTKSLLLDEDTAVFKKNPMSMYHPDAGERLYKLARSSQHDGAILIDFYGWIMNNSINLDVAPGETLTDHGVPNDASLPQRCQLKEDTGTRTIDAKTVSNKMRGAYIIVSGKETGNRRIFLNGETIDSEIAEEITVPKYSEEKLVAV